MTTEELFEEALRLSRKERARLVSQILESLDAGATDPNVEQAWDDEIGRRLQDGDEAYKDMSVEDLRAHLTARVKKKARAT